MSRFALPLQSALVAALRGDTGVSNLVAGRVYDEPPDNSERPFLRVGNIEPAPLRVTGGRGERIVFSVEAYSRPASSVGRTEATRLAAAVVDVLDEKRGALAIPGATVIDLTWSGQTVEREGDGKSYSAIIVFDALIDG